MIKKIDNKYYVYSEDGNKKLSNGYSTEDEAKERLKQIESFKDNDKCPCKSEKFQDTMFTLDMKFKDNQSLESKKVISVRDGYQEYLGAEIGVEPFDKVFKIFRSKDTIEELNDKLKNIPLTIEHLDDLDNRVPEDETVGKILNSKIIEALDKDNDSTINLENEILTFENKLKYNDYKQLSLGYKATTLPHDVYDFEQVDIIPHHLAIVERGRCGDGCKFLDKKGDSKMDLKELLAKLKELLGSAEEQEMMDAIAEMKDMFPKEDTKDEDMEAKEEEIKEMKDTIAKLEKAKDEAVKKSLENFKDSESFKKHMLDAGNERVSVISKAVKYLDKDYKFEDKTNEVIMQDTLKAEFPNESFKDAEIGVAFKMLKDEVKTKEVTYQDSDFKTIEDKFKEEF